MQPQRIIDFHHHGGGTAPADYLRQLVPQAQHWNIHKIVMLGLEWPGITMSSRNRDILACWKGEPGLVVPFAALDMQKSSDPAQVDALREQGFVGLKFIRPPVPYHDERFYPWYDRAQQLKMPCLFHLGIVARLPEWEGHRTDSNLMRPIHLDTIARSFPGLTLVGAHLGNPWYEEAAMSCRWNPNLYFDLSGSTLKRMRPEAIGELLWWGGTTYPAYRDRLGRSAWEKILFGSDVNAPDIGDVIGDYNRLVETLELPSELVDAIFYRTGASLLEAAGLTMS
ncbi:MAG: hypothetical protein A2498_05090 [Lentisphaerae bacterium RIFOXYC12_FULL_60_16]|nr:MAG: hypothetical protein A2498_05090 [Lentisphaerae bacterium RIFOXYC12_FULL_60_16]OGV86151.1 MAG: hypothetical protein A2340_02530 [Lentisphaerae bacterium RIFOXYB12_FULL_60_10]